MTTSDDNRLGFHRKYADAKTTSDDTAADDAERGRWPAMTWDEVADWHDLLAQKAQVASAEVWHSHAADFIRERERLIEAQQARIAELEATVARVDALAKEAGSVSWVDGVVHHFQLRTALRPPHDGEEVDGG